MKKSLLFALGLCAAPMLFSACSDDDDDPEYTDIITFEDATFGADSAYFDNRAYTYSGVVEFQNAHATWGSFFGVSQAHDTITAGYTNDFSIFGTGGNNGSKTFAYCYYSEYSGAAAKLSVVDGNAAGVATIAPNSVYVALTTYAALALRDGNDGGVYGEAVKLKEGGYFSVTFTGYNGDTKTGTVTTYPGDFRTKPLSLMTSWTLVDLKALGEVTRIDVTIGGSDDLYGSYGFNAPAYIAIDDFTFTRQTAK